jgi:hypothetical protein
MTIAERVAKIQTYGQDASFVANVILTCHKNRARKLKGALALLQAGHTLRIGQFYIDILLVDDKMTSWEFLETSPAHFPQLYPSIFNTTDWKIQCSSSSTTEKQN